MQEKKIFCLPLPPMKKGINFIGIWSVKEDLQCKEQCESNGLSGQSTTSSIVRISLSKDMTRDLSPLVLVRDLGGEDLPHKKRVNKNGQSDLQEWEHLHKQDWEIP